MGRIDIEYWRKYEKDEYGGLIDKYSILSGINKEYRIFKTFSGISKDDIYNSIEEYYTYNKENEYHPYRDKWE